MALAFKYRLLCGSVVLSSPLIYHEWYYSQLKEGQHYVVLDHSWSSAADILEELRTSAIAEEIAEGSREWARRHLTDDAFDCYWLHLIRLANEHFPAPQITSGSIPIESAMLDHPSAPKIPVDVIVVIPSRAKDEALMEHARQILGLAKFLLFFGSPKKVHVLFFRITHFLVWFANFW